MQNQHLNLTKEQFQAFLAFPSDTPLQMLNLLKFKDKVAGSDLSGADQYKAYMKAALPFFQKSNAKILFYGEPRFTLIGPSDELEWDKVLIVEYAQKEDFVNMITTEGYPAHLRSKAMADSRLIYCAPA